ncbi:uncharacterized protein [Montipora foliosa]|uniref:uncharacterized protein isoform X1 n=2 Tax=Montipora foliosa TaxID=591990 RepID=UPI0035F1412E
MSINECNRFSGTNFIKDVRPLRNSAPFVGEADHSVPLCPEEQHSRERTPSCSFSCRFAPVAFVFTTVTGQLTQNVVLPLWVDSTTPPPSTSSPNQTIQGKPTLDSYFVVSFSSFVFVFAFGFVILLCDCVYPKYITPTQWRYRWFLMAIGFCQGFSALFIVFSSSGKRTPPYLQSILGNILIPVTMILRFIFLKKIATKRKFISAVVVFVGLFICLLPTVFPSMDSHTATNRNLGGASGPGRILWPLVFMFGFSTSAISFIIEEKAVKMSDKHGNLQASLVSVLFWTSLAQFLSVALCFWTDFVPGFGHAENLQQFVDNWMFGVKCVFGGAGCSWTPPICAFLFITSYLLTVCGTALLLRYSEGATLLAIVLSLCTPLGFTFWMLFEEKPFGWNPTFHSSSWFTVFALLIMIPAAFIYNTGMPETEKQE